MKKNKLRALLKLRELCNKTIGEKETDKLIEDTINEVMEEIKPKRKRSKKEDK